MELLDVMKYKHFCVVGDTNNEEKYAYKIKNTLINKNYIIDEVNKEGSLNNVVKLEVINLCINPVLGLKLLKECKKEFEIILIQPGALNEELQEYLENNKIPYLQGCSLVGAALS